MKGTANQFSFGNFVWWLGVVENRNDPEKLGRHRVRVFGYHSADYKDIPRHHLMWATVVQPTTSSAMSGIGTSPTGIVEGTHVIGFFMDGESAQVPVIFGTIHGVPVEKNPSMGFFDPNGVYPKYPLGESDVNRLAKVEKIDETIVQVKRDNLDTSNVAFAAPWTEKATPYAAQYPYNHVRETESGHIEEFDDTPGAERYGLWHKAGTFQEVHPDGTEVNKIVKDKYTIILGDDYCHVHGDVKITASKNAHILVEGDAFVEVKGDMKKKVHGNYDLEIEGNYNVNVKGLLHTERCRGIRLIRALKVLIN